MSITRLAASGTKDDDSIASSKQPAEKGRVPRSGVKRVTRKFAREGFEARNGNQFTGSWWPGGLPPPQGQRSRGLRGGTPPNIGCKRHGCAAGRRRGSAHNQVCY